MSVSMNPGATALQRTLRERELAGDGLREPDDARLGRGVVGLAGVADEPDDRGDVDDAAGARLHHDRARPRG